MIRTDGGELGIGLRHESLQLFLEQLVSRLGCRGLHGSALGTGLALTLILVATLTGSTVIIIVIGAEAAIVSGRTFPLRLGLQTLDRQIDLAVIIGDDHDLHILTLGQMLADIADVGIGHLRNMYHAGLVLRQGDERTEIGDRLDLTL